MGKNQLVKTQWPLLNFLGIYKQIINKIMNHHDKKIYLIAKAYPIK